MSDILRTPNKFSSLSVKDLLRARDQYHYHLINKTNVVGTGISRYLIRKEDPYPTEFSAKTPSKDYRSTPHKGERTFANSEVRDYSWPCVLVLVRQWQDMSDFGGSSGTLHPDEMVPRTLYLADGGTVPVCVVRVEQSAPPTGALPNWHWPSGNFGGGMPILVESQGRDLAATAGCLVTDGHNVYAITSGHVCGEPGEPVYTMARGQRVLIGTATGKRLTRAEFSKLYPEFASQRTFVQLDIGLIKLQNALDWTSQTFGLGAPGPMADLNEWNITTRLIDAPVVAMGAASGRLEGRIRALFYRYKSVGGYDYVSDFLISPRESADGSVAPASRTRPGDSGAIWHLVTQDGITKEDGAPEVVDDFKGTLRPLALQWGGQVFQETGGQFSYALATSLTSVCQSLDVETMLEHNLGVMPYWGQVGHYTIASFACGLVGNAKLKGFVQDNITQISFTMAELTPDKISEALKAARDGESIVPLADVPDIVWKQHYTKFYGGRDTQWAGPAHSAGPEHPTHYADVDLTRPVDGKSLLQLSLANPAANISVAFWKTFYDDAGHNASRDRGLLPFRVWQFFDAMKGFAAAGKPADYLCAAGVLAHYVGDACQPLHGSKYADGYSDQPMDIVHHKRETGEEYIEHSHVGAGVHSTYESKMIDRHADDLLPKIQTQASALPALPAITSGHAAAVAIVELMGRSALAIPPKDLVDAYLAAGGKSTVAVQDALWNDYGNATAGVMADGARVLAAIWEGAWIQGSGAAIPQAQLGFVDPDALYNLYTDTDFVKSLDLDHIAPELQ
ncbi:MAG: S1/P1 Nuclease [Acidobacteriota bacterium]